MKNSTQYHLMLHNNNATLSHVTQVIQYVCDHPHQQCLQIALIVNLKGECSVKISADNDSLIRYRDKFFEFGFYTHIQARPKINTI